MVLEIKTVYPAEPYRPCEMGSFGKAAGMLLRQFNFPHTYSSNEQLIQADSDRCFSWDFDHSSRCFTQHTGTGELGLENWLREAKNDQVLAFIKDILKADASVTWTGYRVLGSVHRGDGYSVWGLSLFARDQGGTTEVYTGQNAPNVLKRPRYSE